MLVWSLAALLLLAARWIDPPSTAVHIQRRLQAWIHHTPYRERYKFIPLRQISPDLQHAVIAAEDAHFYQHHGFDWHEIQIVAENDLEDGRTRGASTITQQLVKNLFFGTGRSVLRKGAEFTLVPVAEFVLGGDLDLVPIESIVLVEARVLCGDYSVLEIGRDLAERNEFVAFVIRRLANPGLQPALHVHRRCRWVDPPGGHKRQRGKRPEKHHADDEPSNKESEEPRPRRGLGLCVRHGNHISE